MSDIPQLPEDLSKDCKRTGYSSLNAWMNENNIVLAKSDNFFDSLAISIQDGVLTVAQLNDAIAELDENSDKKIYLMNLTPASDLVARKKEILKDLHLRKGIVPSSQKWVNGTVKTDRPTFICLYWDDNLLKIKYSEIQFNVEVDYENDKIIRTEKRVNIVYLIDPKDGFVQIRFDSPGTIHRHKADTGKSTEAAYEGFYKELLQELFPASAFKEMNLNGVANYLANEELKKFRINKGVTTISNNAKQTFATASTLADVRNIPEYMAAASKGTEFWRAEDLTGYWVAKESADELKRDLFMRISRRNAHVRVQRGCLEKELNYGIEKIREIQNSI